MEIVLDAHTLYWFLIEDSKLSQKAKNLILNADLLVVPAIVLMEIFYILKKKEKASDFSVFLSQITSAKYFVYPLDTEVVINCLRLAEKLEMHDAIITTTASMRDAFLVSKDGEIKKVYSKVIW